MQIVILIILGLIIRLLLASLPGYKFDVDTFFAWSIRLNETPFNHFFAPDYFSDYMPGYLYILWLLGKIKILFSINDSSYYILLKIPAILSELAIGLIIYKEIKKRLDRKRGLIFSSLILFNPALIFNSSVWGQVDAVLTLFLILVYLSLNNQKIILSSMLLAISFLVKPQTVAVFPVILTGTINYFSAKNLLKLTLPFIIVIFLLSVLFFPDNTFISLSKHFLDTAGRYHYTSLFAYNFWGAVGFWIPDNFTWNAVSYQLWGIILLTLYWIFIFMTGPNVKFSLLSLFVLATLGFYFLPTRVHERYLYPTLVFLIFYSGLITQKKFKIIMIILSLTLSVIHLLNLYYVYIFYNKFIWLPLYQVLEKSGLVFSLISSMIFIFLVLIIIRIEHAKKS